MYYQKNYRACTSNLKFLILFLFESIHYSFQRPATGQEFMTSLLEKSKQFWPSTISTSTSTDHQDTHEIDLITSTSTSTSHHIDENFWFPEIVSHGAPPQPLDMSFLYKSPFFSRPYQPVRIPYVTYYQEINERFRLSEEEEEEILRMISQIYEEDKQESGATIQRGFKALLETSNLKQDQLQAWYEFLTCVVIRGTFNNHAKPFMRSSIYFGNLSIQLKFKKFRFINNNHYSKIFDLATNFLTAIKILAPSDFHGPNKSLPWGKSITGHFGILNDRRLLIRLVRDEGLFKRALLETERKEERKKAVLKMIKNFKKYNSYKRVLALSIFYSIIKSPNERVFFFFILKKFLDKKLFLSHNNSKKHLCAANYEIKLAHKIYQRLGVVNQITHQETS